MVFLLNRLGHCASDEIIRRIDVGLEETIFTLAIASGKVTFLQVLDGTILIST